jgi:hypothetical protein
MPYCNSAVLVKPGHQEQVAVSILCKSWGCATCGPLRKRQLIAIAIAGAPSTFLTVTLRRTEAETPALAAKKLANAWRKLRRRIMRVQQLQALPFLAVMERHLSGWPHLHILMRAPFIPQAWLSAEMRAIANSTIIDIRRAQSARTTAIYVAKYLTKNPERIGTAKRYWQSIDYQLPSDEKQEHERSRKGGWDREAVNLDHWQNRWQSFGWHVERQSLTRAVARRPW